MGIRRQFSFTRSRSSSIIIECAEKTEKKTDEKYVKLRRGDLDRILKRAEELEIEIANANGNWKKVIPSGNPFGDWTFTRILYLLGGPFSQGCGKSMLHVMNRNPTVFYDSMIHFSHIFAIFFTLAGILGVEQASQRSDYEEENPLQRAIRFLWMLGGCLCLSGLVMCLHLVIIVQRMTPFELQANLFQQPVRMSLAYSMGPMGFFAITLALLCVVVDQYLEQSTRDAGDLIWLLLIQIVAIGTPLGFGFAMAATMMADAARPFDFAYQEYVNSHPINLGGYSDDREISLEKLLEEALDGVNAKGIVDHDKLALKLSDEGITAPALLAAAEAGQGPLLTEMLVQVGLNSASQAFQVAAALIRYAQVGMIDHRYGIKHPW